MADTINLTDKNSRLAYVKDLLREAFPNGGIGNFMENPQPKSLDLMDSEDYFKTPQELVERDADGARRVINYLNNRIHQQHKPRAA
jgi:hypothetical protein